MRASVAEVLGEVKRKTSEVEEMVCLVKALSELREERREASKRKGEQGQEERERE